MSPDAIEGAGYRALRSLYRDAREIGGATLLKNESAPDSAMINRVVGLGLQRSATELDLELILAAMNGVRYFVAVSPFAKPDNLASWLNGHGLEPGWGWMQFSRGVDPLPDSPAELSIRRVGAESGADFASLTIEGFELPTALGPWLQAVPVTAGWSVWLAYDGERAVGCGGLFVDGELGYLAFGATSRAHRGRGSQSALLAARIRHARELGCRAVVTETGEQRADRPSNSYRNILRAGFREEFVVANWLMPRRDAP